MKDQEQVRIFLDSSFSEGLVDTNGPQFMESRANHNPSHPSEAQPADQEEGDDDHAIVRFQIPSSQQLTETEKFRRNISKFFMM